MTSERLACIQSSLLRTIAFFDVLNYAPTWVECASWLEWDGGGGLERQSLPDENELLDIRDGLIHEGKLEYAFGRIAFGGRLATLASLSAERAPLMARKLRRARKAARWILRASGVRFIALVNTTALGQARDEGDLDFFIVVKHGTIWSTRFIAGFPYRLFGRLSGKNAVPDAVCLSYFISDQSLELSSHLLTPDDPYYRYWFCSMLPLYDDGVSRELWNRNASILRLHPFAPKWSIAPDLEVHPPFLRIPHAVFLESLLRRIQLKWFPKQIKERMNRDTSVIVSDSVLKFHVDDRRAEFKTKYLKSVNNLLMSHL